MFHARAHVLGNQFLQENQWFDNNFDRKTLKMAWRLSVDGTCPCILAKKAGFCVSVRAGSLGGEPTARDSPQNYKGIDALQTLQLFILRDVRANLSCALSSYQIEPTARDSLHNYIGIEALEPHQFNSVVHFVGRLS